MISYSSQIYTICIGILKLETGLIKTKIKYMDTLEKIDKVTRLEVINHAKNDKPVGRILTIYKELGDFETIELSYQDGGRTLKIFLS